MFILFILTLSTIYSFGMEEGKETEEISALVEQLPTELQIYITTYLTDADNLKQAINSLSALAQTDQYFNQLLKDPYVFNLITNILEEKYEGEINQLIENALATDNLNKALDNLKILITNNKYLQALFFDKAFQKIQEKQKEGRENPLLYATLLSTLPGGQLWIQKKIETGQLKVSKGDLRANFFLFLNPKRLKNDILAYYKWEFEPESSIILPVIKNLMSLGANVFINLEVFTNLQGLGVSVSAEKNLANVTPLMIAVIHNLEQVVEYLLSIPGIQTSTEDITALEIAQKVGNPRIIKMLQEYEKKKG